MVNFVRETGGIEYADQKARGYIRKAKKALVDMEGLDYKENLIKLADFVVCREN